MRGPRAGRRPRCPPAAARPPGTALDPLPRPSPTAPTTTGRRAARSSTAHGRGRHRAGPARAGRRALRRLRRARLGAGHGQGHGQGGPGGPAGMPQVPLARRTATPRRRRPRRWTTVGGELGLPAVREAGQPGLVGRRHPRPTTATSCGGRATLRLQLRRVGRGRGGGHRPRDRGRRARQRRAAGRRCPARSCPAAEFYDYEDKYLDGAGRAGHPRRPAAPRSPSSSSDLAVAGLPGAAVRGHGPRRLLLRGGRPRACCSTRSTPSRASRPISMYPKLWEASGLPYAELIDELVAPRPRAPRAPDQDPSDQPHLPRGAPGN